ncbi:MAG: hypothetical protein ACOX8W_11430 [bacterium]|jgi:hypothetical protein
MKFNLEISATRLNRGKSPAPSRHPVPPEITATPATSEFTESTAIPPPPYDTVVQISLPPKASAVIPEWFELSSPGGASLLLRLPGKSTGLTFGQLYKAVKEAGGTITADD